MAPRPLPQSPPFPHHSTLQWHPAMAPSNGTTSTPPKLVVTLHLNHSTLQWHPAMAPSNGTTSTPRKLVVYNGTPAMALRPLRQSWSSPSLPRAIAHYNGTLQWHPAMAPSNGTTSIPPKPKLVVTLPPHTTMVPYDGTQQWHHVHCTLQWHPGATSNPPKWFVALPLLEVRTPIAIAIWGTTSISWKVRGFFPWLRSWKDWFYVSYC